jgi:hypothetical protein
VSAAHELSPVRQAAREDLRGHMVLDADPHDGPMAMGHFARVARNADRTVVIASGFRRDMAERCGRAFFWQDMAERCSRAVLRGPAGSVWLLGGAPSEVSRAMLTHLQNDRADNLEEDPAARFHLQEREMAVAIGRRMRFACRGRAAELAHLLDAPRLNSAGRAELRDGEADVADGVAAHPGGGQTPALRPVRVRTRRAGWCSPAAPAATTNEDIGSSRPFRLVSDAGGAPDAFRAVRRLAGGDVGCEILGGGPEVMRRYETPRPRLGGVAARLDRAGGAGGEGRDE